MLIYKLAFNTWLEKAHPHHNEYDFNTKGEYETWKRQLFEAYVAGVEFEQIAIKAGM